jgi:5-methylthioadenosine/S-adenosylhomocysteine deaminase
MQNKHADLIIENGIVLTMDAAMTTFSKGAVAVCGDSICAVLDQQSLPQWTASDRIDAGGGIIMPGLVNTHTHAAMTCFRGMADDLPLMTWLNEYIFPAESKLDHDMVYFGSLLACAEMIFSGTTCFSDMYLFEDAVACAAKHAGIRAVVGEVLYDFPSPNYGPIENGFEYVEMLFDKWEGDPLISIAVEPHSAYLCSPDLLRRSAELARKHGAPMIIHLSETQSELQDIHARYGKTPVGHLADIGVLSAELLACHCVVLTEDDIGLLKMFDVKVAHNPESNMKLASGIAPVGRLLESGICVGLGTDGCASNNDLDMFAEMDTAAKLHKVHNLDPTVCNSSTVLRMATINAAKALGLSDRIGSLEAGKKADIIIVDTQKPHLTPMYHPESHLVYAVRGSDVSHCIINGKPVMADRKLLTFDMQDVMQKVNLIASELKGP